ncbi:MAG: type I restriction enzyme HsdR N-terminal domain-containing protein [Haliscomenobacter sp.]|nr:type I restriction enzyme HsdR N-terminal domain-containing protein [Haliscomenobacter sp.]
MLQPEESVRQALLIYLLEEKGVPRNRIAVEKSFWSTAFPEERIF